MQQVEFYYSDSYDLLHTIIIDEGEAILWVGLPSDIREAITTSTYVPYPNYAGSDEIILLRSWIVSPVMRSR